MITRPLADRMRPETFADVFGDEKLFSEGGIFPRMIETGHIPNMIFYGPSGTGKTLSSLSCWRFSSSAAEAQKIISANT